MLLFTSFCGTTPPYQVRNPLRNSRSASIVTDGTLGASGRRGCQLGFPTRSPYGSSSKRGDWKGDNVRCRRGGGLLDRRLEADPGRAFGRQLDSFEAKRLGIGAPQESSDDRLGVRAAQPPRGYERLYGLSDVTPQPGNYRFRLGSHSPQPVLLVALPRHPPSSVIHHQ